MAILITITSFGPLTRWNTSSKFKTTSFTWACYVCGWLNPVKSNARDSFAPVCFYTVPQTTRNVDDE